MRKPRETDCHWGNVCRFRLWPQAVDMVAVAALFRQTLAGGISPQAAADRLAQLCPRAEFANGYIHGREGHIYLESDA